MISLQVNGKKYSVDVPPDTPLLWVLRDNLKLTGTKYGCGIGECGSCTVHVDGKALRSCVTAVGDVHTTQTYFYFSLLPLLTQDGQQLAGGLPR